MIFPDSEVSCAIVECEDKRDNQGQKKAGGVGAVAWGCPFLWGAWGLQGV